jgi:PAS domain S-box-containing protein
MNKQLDEEKITKRKQVLKEIILQLHKGLSLEEAKSRFEQEIGDISLIEIITLEQSLMQDGISSDEIKKFCNVHAMLFESSLKSMIKNEESAAHPITLLKLENREIEKRLNDIRDLLNDETINLIQLQSKLNEIKMLEKHYAKKEQVLFPYLERAGVMGPSKVMWGKDNDIRDLLKQSITSIAENKPKEEITSLVNSFMEESQGMIFKEENILFPLALEKIKIEEWIEILKECAEIGWVDINIPTDINRMILDLKQAIEEEPKIKADGNIAFPTGTVHIKDLMYMLNALPVDISFVDKNDRVAYFSDNKERIFVRTKSVIGRQVKMCHPPNSVDKVEEIINNFKQGKKDYYDFWINYRGKFILIRYFAVRDKYRNYLGTLEVTQDITNIRNLKGEKRLLYENN